MEGVHISPDGKSALYAPGKFPGATPEDVCLLIKAQYPEVELAFEPDAEDVEDFNNLTVHSCRPSVSTERLWGVVTPADFEIDKGCCSLEGVTIPFQTVKSFMSYGVGWRTPYFISLMDFLEKMDSYVGMDLFAYPIVTDVIYHISDDPMYSISETACMVRMQYPEAPAIVIINTWDNDTEYFVSPFIKTYGPRMLCNITHPDWPYGRTTREYIGDNEYIILQAPNKDAKEKMYKDILGKISQMQLSK